MPESTRHGDRSNPATNSVAPVLDSTRPPPPPLLEMRGISKSFAGVRVLSDVSLTLLPGEVHILAGENGAGKSTLMKILAGVHTPDTGDLLLESNPVRFTTPHAAARAGIAVIHQEMSLIGPMTVADNLFLGREPTRLGFLRRATRRRRSRELLARFGLEHLDLSTPVERLPLSTRQLLEIAKALAFDSRVIVMDEPTSALTDPEVERLFTLIADLRSRGCGIVYISHKMEEIYHVADRITVLRDGRHIATAPASEMPSRELIRLMVGRELSDQFPPRAEQPGTVSRLRVECLSLRDPSGAPRLALDNITFTANQGEIVGLAGLQGCGNSELLQTLFGVYGAPEQGRVSLDGTPYPIRSPRAAIRRRVALLTNDRKDTGLILGQSVRNNITLAALPALSPAGLLRPARETSAAVRRVYDLRIRLASPDQEVGSLSGGNQQKVVLAKWLETNPLLLLLDEPTRGVDVGAKHEIYELINRLAAAGTTILLVTSEMPELLALSDRILVLHRGHITAEMTRQSATQESILQAAMGETQHDHAA